MLVDTPTVTLVTLGIPAFAQTTKLALSSVLLMVSITRPGLTLTVLPAAELTSNSDLSLKVPMLRMLDQEPTSWTLLATTNNSRWLTRNSPSPSMFQTFHAVSMALFISLRCQPMVEKEHIQMTRPVLITVLDIVMPSAHTTLNSSMVKLTPKVGTQVHLTPTQEAVNTDPAAWSSTSGRLTASLRLSLLILALPIERDAKEPTAVMTPRIRDTLASATKMVAISPPSDMENALSMDQAANSKLTPPRNSRSLLNSSPTTEQIAEKSLRLGESMSRTERSLKLHL